jgi:hypothetical protein
LIREAGRRNGEEELCVFCVSEESSVKRERARERDRDREIDLEFASGRSVLAYGVSAKYESQTLGGEQRGPALQWILSGEVHSVRDASRMSTT